MAEQNRFQRNVKSRTTVGFPRMYHVVMYNDDFTPMDFVVDILMSIFNKSEKDAFQIMYAIHRGVRAVVATYTYDVAMTKVDLATKRARAEGYPFVVKAEPADAYDEEV